MEALVGSRELTSDDLRVITSIREAAVDFLMVIQEKCPDGRAKALAKTNTEDAVHWAVKAVAHAAPATPAETPEQRGERAYEAYSRATGGKTFDGRDMPSWEFLGDTIQAAWIAAGSI